MTALAFPAGRRCIRATWSCNVVVCSGRYLLLVMDTSPHGDTCFWSSCARICTHGSRTLHHTHMTSWTKGATSRFLTSGKLGARAERAAVQHCRWSCTPYVCRGYMLAREEKKVMCRSHFIVVSRFEHRHGLFPHVMSSLPRNPHAYVVSSSTSAARA